MIDLALLILLGIIVYLNYTLKNKIKELEVVIQIKNKDLEVYKKHYNDKPIIDNVSFIDLAGGKQRPVLAKTKLINISWRCVS